MWNLLPGVKGQGCEADPSPPTINGKGEGEVHPITGHEDPKGE